LIDLDAARTKHDLTPAETLGSLVKMIMNKVKLRGCSLFTMTDKETLSSTNPTNITDRRSSMDDYGDNCHLKLVSSFKKEVEVGSLVVGAYDRSMGLDQGTIPCDTLTAILEKDLSSPPVSLITVRVIRFAKIMLSN
jgi:hypothetical protein